MAPFDVRMRGLLTRQREHEKPVNCHNHHVNRNARKYFLCDLRANFAPSAVKSFSHRLSSPASTMYPHSVMRGLNGKRVLITGGASGIGAATAARFLEEGSHLVVLDRDTKGCDEIRRLLPGMAGTVHADVSNLQQVQSAFAEAVKLMGGVDVLINNAGISIRHNFLEITPEEWDKVLAVNLTGVFYVAQTAARHMW